MDRLNRVLSGGTLILALGILITAPGCKSTEKVPPGKQYPTTGGPPGQLNFNSDPHPNNAVGGAPYGNNTYVPGMAGGMQGGGSPMTTPGVDGSLPGMGTASTPPQYGTPAPNTSSYGTPAAGAYGGTVGTASPSPYGGGVK